MPLYFFTEVETVDESIKDKQATVITWDPSKVVLEPPIDMSWSYSRAQKQNILEGDVPAAVDTQYKIFVESATNKENCKLISMICQYENNDRTAVRTHWDSIHDLDVGLLPIPGEEGEQNSQSSTRELVRAKSKPTPLPEFPRQAELNNCLSQIGNIMLVQQAMTKDGFISIIDYHTIRNLFMHAVGPEKLVDALCYNAKLMNHASASKFDDWVDLMRNIFASTNFSQSINDILKVDGSKKVTNILKDTFKQCMEALPEKVDITCRKCNTDNEIDYPEILSDHKTKR